MDEPREVVKPRNWLESLNCAIEGVIYAFRTQRHVRYHYAIAAAALLASLLLDLPMTEFALFSLSIVVLLFAEMINTAVEEAVNLIEDRHHMMAKNAKDVSAGAVLISSIGVAVMVYMIFSKYLYEPMRIALRETRDHAGHVAVVSLLLVLIGVIALKALTGKGRPLHGGMPSGHAAVAFSLFTSITFLTLDPLVAVLAFIMAVMVSQSRLLGGIHTRLEILMGSLLGSALTLLVFEAFLAVFE
jgi:diacylglycerol kinase (ATP)